MLHFNSRDLNIIGYLRAQLGEENFAAAWMEGRALTDEQAVNYALAGNLPSVGSITQHI